MVDEQKREPSREGEEHINRFKIAFSKDHMQLHLYPLIGVTDGGLTNLEEILDACARENVKLEIDEAAINAQIRSEYPVETIIAKGKRPRDGRDGSISFTVDVSAKPQFIAEPKNGEKIDYRSAMQVTLVAPGDVLAEITPPTPGEQGFDVHGRVLEPAPGAPARIHLGEGVEEVDGKAVATVAGTPSYYDDELLIKRNYVLQGDVDLSTGNIAFPGTVIIHGNVTDGFEVSSDENVVVNGIVDGAKIRAKGYVKCAGGIQGKGKAEVIAGTFVSAMYVESASIVAETDVMVTKDVLHSRISCLGTLKLGGSLIGGETIAFKGVECSYLGSEMGVRTPVNIRKHYRQEKAKEQVEAVLQEANAILERVKQWANLTVLDGSGAEKLLQDQKNIQGLIQKRQLFDNRVAQFDKQVQDMKTASVKIWGMLYPDVTVASPFSKYIATSPIPGPITVLESNSAGTMAVIRG